MKEANLPAVSQTADRTDEELLSGFLDGEERCFAVLMNRYRDRVFRLVLRYLNGDRDAAEDVAQQAFVKVFTEGAKFRGEGSLRSWLFTVAVNLAISETRRRARLSPEPAEVAVETHADAAMDRAAMSARLREAAARLPEKQRLVLTLRIDAELPFSEIARIARMSENSAKVNYHHAVTALKRMLK
ncbi:MAG: sigma-70 family RNA polymerase sigma factor [Deltaproteobacteria bacterium]|nr:sigma-70 family RNA polymerase sigma factor [Deltaproteobacteria bacterium]